MADAAENTKLGKTPPYVSWKTFKSLVADLSEHGMPSRIDRSILRRFSGVVGTQLMTALRFFNFIDADGHPSDEFRVLVKAHGTPQWNEYLGAIVKAAYAPVFTINLADATPQHFSDTFKKAFPGTDAVLQKCATFFIQAAQDAGIAVSDRVLKGRKPRTVGRKRTAKPADQKSAGAGKSTNIEDEEDEEDDDSNNGRSDFARELLSKFPAFDPNWPDNIKAEWFKGFEKFMELNKK